MRKVTRTGSFKKDFKRQSKGVLGPKLEDLLRAVVPLLADDAQMPPERRDHPLKGEWTDHRDCHVTPDLVLIYRKTGDVDTGALQLVRLGTHSELFGR
jgi:mRNA interferase YafQ